MTVIVLATLSPSAGEAFMVLADIAVLLVLTPYIFAAAHYVQRQLVPAQFI